jgi:anti-sigma factor RsiW
MVTECGEARKIIYLTSGEEPLTSELIEAKRHIEHCAKCSEFFREEESLKNLIREKAPREKAPPSLRENILAEIGKRHGQGSSNRFYDIFLSNRIARIIPPLFIGVFLILALSSIFYFVSSNQEAKSLVSLLAEDHITNIPEAAQILSSEPVNIEGWFRGKIDFVVKIPELPGAKLLGGRLCRINNNRIALLFYEKDRKPISLFVMDDSLADLSSIGKAEINGKKLRYQSEKGCNLIFWQEKGIVYALVSDIQREELMRLVPETVTTE